MTGRDLRRRLAQAAIGLYPPAWRSRYAEEVHALVEDGQYKVRDTLSLGRGAVSAWARPQPHLYTPAGRVRASLATVTVLWTLLAGLGLIFGQLTEDQGLHTLTPGHPSSQIWYQVYVVSAHASVIVVLIGGLPVWWTMALTAWRRRRRDLLLLAAPAIAPLVFLIVLIVTARLVDRPGGDGVGQGWFLALTAVGFVAAAVAAGGPALALRRLEPAGPALRIAGFAAIAALVTMTVAAAASVADGLALSMWSPNSYAVYHSTWALASYTTTVAILVAGAASSALRGLRISGRTDAP